MTLPRREAVQQRKLLRAARRGDRGARDRLTAAHLKLVRKIAMRYRGLGLPVDDLVQEGSIGLLEAIDRYDPSKQKDFEAFARFRIRRAMRNALTDQARLVRLPQQMVERQRMLAKQEARFAAANGRAPTSLELAATTGLKLRSVLDARRAAIAPVSLDRVAAPDGSTLETLVADTSARNPEDETLSSERARLVRSAVRDLPPRHRRVVTRRFGLAGEETAIVSIAKELGLSERRIRTIEQDALYGLGASLDGLRVFP
jgi:RNA polymerase primary sigma factor